MLPEDLRLGQDEAVRAAQRLIDEGRPFHAHEVLEAAWKAAPADQRATWKGLAQIAVGLTHARRGNAKGAVALLGRGAAALPPSPDLPAGSARPHAAPASGLPASLDLPGARHRANRLAARIASDGLGSLTEADFRLRLTP